MPLSNKRLVEQGLLWRRGLVTLRRCRRGLIAYFSTDAFIGGCLSAYGEISENDFAVLRHLIGPGDVVIDAGSNIGVHSLFFSQRVGPKGQVFAFEPQAAIYRLLQSNLTLNGIENVQASKLALGRERGELQFGRPDYRKVGNFGGFSLKDFPAGSGIKVIPLDDLNLPRVDFIKADVEGMEGELLAGATKTIARHRPLLWLECDRPGSPQRLLQQMEPFGYRFAQLAFASARKRNFYRETRDIFFERFGRHVGTKELIGIPAERPWPAVLQNLPEGVRRLA